MRQDRKLRSSTSGQGRTGLTLDPHTAGEIVYRLERPPDSLVWVKLDFYNQLWEPPGQLNAAITFPNRVEVSTDGGETYRTLAENTSFGEVIPDRQGFDPTPELGAATTYYIRLSAHNTTGQAVPVLPLMRVSVVVDPGWTTTTRLAGSRLDHRRGAACLHHGCTAPIDLVAKRRVGQRGVAFGSTVVADSCIDRRRAAGCLLGGGGGSHAGEVAGC